MSGLMLPGKEALEDHFGTLFDVDVKISVSQPRELVDTDVIVGFRTESGQDYALMIMDLPLAVGSAGALGVIPRGSLEVSLKSQRVEPKLMANVQEIGNISMGLFRASSAAGPRLLRLLCVQLDAASYPRMARLFRQAGSSAFFTVSLGLYGQGSIAFALIHPG